MKQANSAREMAWSTTAKVMICINPNEEEEEDPERAILPSGSSNHEKFSRFHAPLENHPL